MSNEKVHVTKSVDLVRTQKQLSLYFSEFSMICYGFLKFTVLKKETKHCTEAPGKILGLSMESLAGLAM